MQHGSVSAWQELSALYEQADEFDRTALAAWLASPEIAGHAQLPALRRMLAARDHLRDSDFLNVPPQLGAPAAAPADPVELHAGASVGPYRLLRPLGAGGMAEVWLAERGDAAFRRSVAIKLMHRHVGGAARDSVAQRFARERDILASLDHPNIAALHDAGITPAGQPWLALEYVEGRPLTDWCDAAGLGVVERVRLFRQVLMAVQHAHANLVMHRDLKPANILVARNGEVRLLDFGIAKLFDPREGAQADTELTRAAGRLMTPLYASPEQLRGEPLTIACDVYALGVVLYELLSGERPYEVKAESALQLEQAILEAEPRAPSRRHLREEAALRRGTSAKGLGKVLAGDLDAIVLQALAKQPAQRYASADAMLADLDRWLAGAPVEAHAPSAVYRWGKFVRRYRVGVGLGSAAMLALAGVATVAVVQRQEAQRESARAVAARDFMIDMFRSADTSKVRGADITARELLDSGRKDVSQRLARQPELQTDLLLAIASIQSEMGEYVKAEGTYDEAARLLEERRDYRGAALARGRHAEAVYQLGEHARALASLEKARASAARIGPDDEVGARLDWLEAWIRIGLGDSGSSRPLFERSLARATRAFGPDNIRTIEALQGLAKLAADRGDVTAALALQDDILQRAGRSHGLNPRDLPTLDYEHVMLLYRVGRYRTAFENAQKAAVECASSVGPKDETCRLLISMKIQAALRLGLVEQVRSDLPILEAIAGEGLSPRHQAYALHLVCRLRAALDGVPAAPQLESQLLAVGDSKTLDADVKSTALLGLADGALRAGRPAAAEAWTRRALGAEFAAGTSATNRAWAHMLLGVALVQQRQFDAGLRWLRQSQGDYASLIGATHPLTLVFGLNQGVALAALGRLDEARSLVARAQPVLREAMGEDAPTYRRVLEFQRRLVGPAQESGHLQVPPSDPLPFFI